MSRREDLDRFYYLLNRLEMHLGGTRNLAECNGRMDWPERGVYFFFEDGEYRENGEPRVVRVGTHALKTGSRSKLWNRLSQHRGTNSGGGNHRGSVFRLHVGTALIERDGLHSATWSVGSTAKGEIREREYSIEKLVSEHIGQMLFLWLDIDDLPGPDSMRGYIERNSIELLSNFNKPQKIDAQSEKWLGKFVMGKNANKIRESGLWNVDHVESDYKPEFLYVLEKSVGAF
ncbi:MAG: hypothetical protein Q7J68_04440 [Thermoplasmata archaeon]|nr:hypothetical protein [Thermoplasmata archaeon]